MDHEHFMRHRNMNSDLRNSMSAEVIKALNLGPSDVVFDIGSGDGFYSMNFAKLSSKVYSIDAYEDNFQNPNYSNSKIEKIATDICEWIKSNDFSDASHVFFSNSFHDIECQDGILKILSKSLKKGSHLDMVEFKLETQFGPPKSFRFSKEMLKSKVEPYGFKEVNYIEFEYHYFISFEKI
ncbi:MAG: hypothetical protein C0176_04275 [Mesoaciditoga sp.]|uniref:class I SAM-dependent methyltransferase n=1 Tax=Athalassotoga sp. TaxID=2022597 RepID=UPI000CBDFFCD|nr:MAG: hypothetical protein C0185_03625 [Mesoaciditoga sp.]PMP79767.1 MAG: hypothetical protein C0176_04275 [Mesoaciditoga sp.]HEU24102.1 hypothetical protein [Mesoaciditoga lauensis]